MSDLDADHLKELEKILLDDDQVSEGQLREDVSKELKPPGKRERVRGRPSRNRRKRKRRSSESPSSSSSYSSSLDSSEDSELDSHPLLDRRLAGREEEGRRKFEPPSPLQELQEKIPKKIEFSSSIREAPEIAGLEKKKLRARVRIADIFLEHFDTCAAGMYVGMEERLSYYERLPLVASPLATVPVLDEGLRAINYRLPLDEQAMVADSECVMNAINLLAISRNEAAEQRFERADSYVKQAMELLGISIHDFNVRRRERFFRSYGVDPLRSVPNYRRLPVEVPTRSADKPWNEFAGGLIGSKLATEIVEKTQCQRLTEALLKERKSFYQKRDRTQKRHHSRSTKKEKSRESRSSVHSSGCIQANMVGDLRLRISTIQHGRSSSQQGGSRASKADTSVPRVAKSTLVAVDPTTHQGGRANQQPSGFTYRLVRKATPLPSEKELSTDRMSHLIGSWKKAGLYASSVNVLMANWSEATVKQYDAALSKWSAYCSLRNINHIRPRVQDIINFLSKMFLKGASFSAVNTCKSALVSYLEGMTGSKQSEDDKLLLARFMKGVFRLRPSRPRYNAVWDVSQVVRFLDNLGNNESLSTRQLTLKLTMLLALTSPKRVSELASLSLESLQQGDSRWVFRLDYVNKNRRVGAAAHSACFTSFPENTRLCPIETMKAYISRTVMHRSKTRYLLISLQRPFRGVTATTVSRWLKETLVEAGVGSSFGAHSTRAAATTAAKLRGVSSKAIMEAANWAPNGSTFERFYFKGPLESFQDSILAETYVEEACVIDKSSVI